MVHQVFNDAFEALLAGWHRYMDLAATTDDAHKLAELREEIDALRERANRLQRIRSLDEGGDEDRDLAAYCPYIRTTIYVPNSDIRYTRDDILTFRCACDRQVGHQPKEWLQDAGNVGTKAADYSTGRTTRGRRLDRS